ncbi:efflux RND transporter permease subunit [Thalassoglobus sp.]|uniref:efflux RND transporter permease subunit n=1 Tax=Thalassoglobus sp. TaxID=2795869 RepID=UPI003AA93844
MERIFNIRDWWGNGITLWVVVLLLFTTPLLVIALKDVSLENDITTWLPAEDPDAQSLEWFSEQFERGHRLVVSWDSSSLNDSRVESFATALQAESNAAGAGVESITTPHDVIRTMIDNKVSREDAVKRLTGTLVGVGFLKVKLSEAGREDLAASMETVRKRVSEIVEAEASILPPVNKLPGEEQIQPDDKQIDQATDIRVEFPIHDFQLRWPEMTSDTEVVSRIRNGLASPVEGEQVLVEDVFFAAGAPVAVSILLGNIDDHEIERTVKIVEATALTQGIEVDELRLAGTPISRIRLNEAAKRAVWNTDYPIWNVYKRAPILLSALVSIIVSFTLLKSVRLSILVTLASVFTCLVVIAMIPLTGKSLNMVLIVLPDLLLVLTTSGAIHVANYWKHAVTNGDENPIVSAVKMAWQPCALASITTAIGMASLLFAVLAPVQQFGFYASIGCLISLFMILFGFPSMMSVWPGRGKKFAEHAEKEATAWGHFARKIVHHQFLITTSCVGLFIFSITGLQWFKTETKVIRYFPAHSQISQDYHFLEEGLSGIVSVDTVIRFNEQAVDEMNINDRMELVRKVEENISKHRWISGTMSLADFRNPVEPPAENASTRTKVFYGRTLQRIQKAIFEGPIEETSQFARKATAPLDLMTHGKRKIQILEDDEIWRVRAQSIITADVNFSILTSELEQIIQETIADEAGTDYLVTGMVPLFLRTQQAVLESLIKSFGLAFGIIAVVMIVLLYSPTSGFLAMLPNLFPVGVVFGLVAWIGMPVDIGTMITASVALGIAIDGTLHLLTWYRDGIRHGMTQEDAVVMALQHCGPAMWQTSATISIGMVMVSGADLLLISRFGLLMAALVTTALLADVVLLPALLAGWLGRIIKKNTPVLEQPAGEKPETIEFPKEPAGEAEGSNEATPPVRVHTQS